MESAKLKERSDLVSAVTAPLGFFALSLLIVEGFLAITMVFSDLSTSDKFWGMIIGASLFLIVVLGVLLLVWHRPMNLTFGEDSHLEHERMGLGSDAISDTGSVDMGRNNPSIQ